MPDVFKVLHSRWLVCVWLVAAACGTAQPKVPLAAFAEGGWEAIEAYAANELATGDPNNEAILQNVRGQAAMYRGDLAEARRCFATAYQIMGTWAVDGSEVYKAIFGNESSKTYRGDPYERGMNAFYLALADLWHGEPDNARACLINGILADAESAEPDESGGSSRVREDNALLFWMAGRMGRLAGSSDVAQFFADAQEAHAFAKSSGSGGSPSPAVLMEPAAGNVVVLVEVGLGPEKFSKGSGDPIARFRQRATPLGGWRNEAGAAAHATVAFNDKPVGASETLLDVFYQATTRGGTAMEGVRKGKAVLKIATAVAGVQVLKSAMRENDAERAAIKAAAAGVLFLAAWMVSSDADIRHWPSLPSTVQVVTATLPPGRHNLTVDFLDNRGAVLRGLRQQAVVEVPAQGEAWLLVRAVGGPAVTGPAVVRTQPIP